MNLLLTSWLARASGGRLLLRIDDFDTGRTRPEYLADVFDVLDWLGIHVDQGPRDPADFHAAWSMTLRAGRFREALEELRARHPGTVFVCRCSRLRLSSDGRCRAGCRGADLPLEAGASAVRVHVPAGRSALLGARRHPVPPGDHVLWRRDDLPAYQLGSLVADLDLEVTAIVRGLDLLDSSALQCHLADLLDQPRFTVVDFRHHGLLAAEDGSKLSKSAGAQAHPMPRTPELRELVRQLAHELGAPVGIVEP